MPAAATKKPLARFTVPSVTDEQLTFVHEELCRLSQPVPRTFSKRRPWAKAKITDRGFEALDRIGLALLDE